jgi:DNA-directed RNA polymerase alpha subunit
MIKTDVIERLHKLAEKATEEDAKELNAIANDVTMCMFSIDQFTVRLSGMIETPNEKEETRKAEMEELLKKDICDTELSVRTINCLRWAEIYTLGDLTKRKAYDILRIRNLGHKSFKEIENLFTRYGLKFSN